jgi:hypothetical protein
MIEKAGAAARPDRVLPVVQDDDVGVIAGDEVGAAEGPAGVCWRGRGVRAGAVVVSLS